MGRKRSFDDRDVLRVVADKFWRQGYHGTSVQQLADETGVQAGSLYQCFGDKKDLYLSALKYYADEDSPRAQLLRSFDMPAADAIGALCDDIINRTKSVHGAPGGCFVSNHVSELRSYDDDVAERSVDLMRSVRKTMRMRLAWSQEQGELAARADIDALAGQLFCIMQGLYVLSVSTRNIGDMQAARDLAVAMVKQHLRGTRGRSGK